MTDFKPGDLAIIECEDNAGVHVLARCGVDLGRHWWVGQDLNDDKLQCRHAFTSYYGQSAQWVAVLNPADDEQIRRERMVDRIRAEAKRRGL